MILKNQLTRLIILKLILLCSCQNPCPSLETDDIKGFYISANEEYSDFLYLDESNNYITMSFQNDTLFLLSNKWEVNHGRCSINFQQFRWFNLPENDIFQKYKTTTYASFEYKYWGLDIYLDRLNFNKVKMINQQNIIDRIENNSFDWVFVNRNVQFESIYFNFFSEKWKDLMTKRYLDTVKPSSP